MKKLRLALVICLSLVVGGALFGCAGNSQKDNTNGATGNTGSNVTSNYIVLTVDIVALPQNDSFSEVTLTDPNGNSIAFPSDPSKWFENATFASMAAPSPDGFYAGIHIDETNGNTYLVKGGDKVNMTFSINSQDCIFAFGPGTQIAVEKTATGYNLVPSETESLSPPQEKSINTQN